MRKGRNTILNVKLDLYTQSAIFCLALIIIVGLGSRFLANTKPFYAKIDNTTYFPVFSKQVNKISDNPGGIDWSNYRNTSHIVFAPIPYSPGESDVGNANYRPPFSENRCFNNLNEAYSCKAPVQFHHWLGTNLKGEDLLSGLIHGTSVSLKIGFFSILIALCIGTLLGIMAGYFQNDTLKVPLLSFIFMVVSIIPSIYFSELSSFFVGEYVGWKNTGLFIGTLFIYMLCISLGVYTMFWVGKLIHHLFKWKHNIHFPVDSILSRLIEIFAAIPKLMLIVAMAAILTRGVNNIIIIIGISSWAGIARLIRAETLKLRNQDFITSSKALGLSHFKIMYTHILPNIAGPIMVSFVFGMSAAILIESGLSFLNIGVPENVITWGQLLADGKNNFNAWWLIVFPGFAIFITVLCLNIIGEKFKSLLDPSNKGLS